MATIHDIAQISGYSIGTVSRVINNRPDVSDKAREKIEKVIRELDYQPNSNARMLRQTISPEISIIVCGVNSMFLLSVLEKMQIRIGEHGESANVQFVRDTEDEVITASQIIQNQKSKGLIFLGGNLKAFQKEFDRIDVPSVLVLANGEGLGYENLSSFCTDDRAAAGYAVRMLVSQGHRRIGILGGYPGDAEERETYCSPAALRIQGAIEELERNGIDFDLERDYERCPFTGEGGYLAMKKLLLRTPDLTGIFGINDALALGAIRAIRDMGLSIPKDLSMVGFDGVIFSKYSIPRLTTIQQDTEMLAKKGVDDLLMRVSYECSAVHEKIPYRYVSGESVARPRGME